jgi:hypothetical protein
VKSEVTQSLGILPGEVGAEGTFAGLLHGDLALELAAAHGALSSVLRTVAGGVQTGTPETRSMVIQNIISMGIGGSSLPGCVGGGGAGGVDRGGDQWGGVADREGSPDGGAGETREVFHRSILLVAAAVDAAYPLAEQAALFPRHTVPALIEDEAVLDDHDMARDGDHHRLVPVFPQALHEGGEGAAGMSKLCQLDPEPEKGLSPLSVDRATPPPDEAARPVEVSAGSLHGLHGER